MRYECRFAVGARVMVRHRAEWIEGTVSGRERVREPIRLSGWWLAVSTAHGMVRVPAEAVRAAPAVSDLAFPPGWRDDD